MVIHGYHDILHHHGVANHLEYKEKGPRRTGAPKVTMLFFINRRKDRCIPRNQDTGSKSRYRWS